MLAVDYLNVVRHVLDRIQHTQLEPIDRAAEAIVESALAGGAWHLHDTGHMVSQELVHRAGGRDPAKTCTAHIDRHCPSTTCRLHR